MTLRVTPGRPLLLEVDPDLDREDRAADDRRFVLTLRSSSRMVIETRFSPADLDRRRRLLLLVPADRAPIEGRGELVLTRESSGRHGEGELLWRRALRFARGE